MAQQATEKEDSKVALDMADLPLPELEEEPEEEQAPPRADSFDPAQFAPDEDKKPRSKIIILGGGALLVLVLLAAVWFLFLRTPAEKPPQEAPDGHQPPVASQPVGPPRVTLDPFIIPVRPDPRGRLLKLIIMLEFNSLEEKDAIMGANTPAIRDCIYRALRDRPLEEINSERLNNVLPAMLKEQINKTLGQHAVKQVYFPAFLFAG